MINPKYFLILLTSLLSLNLFAHQPDISSTMLVEREDGVWLLQVRAALTGFEYEVNTHYGEDAYPNVEKFQELVISHLIESISVNFNGAHDLYLQNGRVTLGHETKAVFEIRNVPEIVNSISVKNSSFENISRNQCALIVLKDGFTKEQFILNEENDHEIQLQLINSKFIPYSQASSKLNSLSTYLVIGILLIGIFLLKDRFR